MAPALVTVLITLLAPGLRGAVAAGCSTFVVGVGFAVTNATQFGADFAPAAWTVLSGPSTVLADATDLLALPALGVAWWAWQQVQANPAPNRVVRLVRVCLVLPFAAMATMATSASMPPPEGTFVGSAGGQVVVETPEGLFASADGTRWHAMDLGLRLDPGGPAACLPDLPTRCYRVVPGRLAVDQGHDADWTMA